MDMFGYPHQQQQQPGLAYADDGLGGLGGPPPPAAALLPDDGLGGFAPPPPQQHYAEDGLLMYDAAAVAPPDLGADGGLHGLGGGAPAASDTPGGDADAELNDALDRAFELGDAATPGGLDSASQPAPSRTPAGDDDDDDDEATEDEVLGSEHGNEAASGRAEPSPAPEDPVLAEQQRQNAWYKECFDAMSEAQRNRLEAYIRSNLQKKTMKKVLTELTGASMNERLVIALSSITKMFVGELVETARQIAARQGHTSALLPCHIRAAYQALEADGRVPHRGPSKPMRLHM